jgi:hypothetical protein
MTRRARCGDQARRAAAAPRSLPVIGSSRRSLNVTFESIDQPRVAVRFVETTHDAPATSASATA